MQQLSSLDASFLYMESARTPMHIGGVYIFEPLKNKKANLFEVFKTYLAGRIHLSPLFRQRVLEAPLEMSHPYWVDDPDFDLEAHIDYVALPQPADLEQLHQLAARIFSRPLNHKRPLWEITLVEGLNKIPHMPKGSFAMIAKLHQAAIDGISGEEVMSILLDTTPQPAKVPAEKYEWEPAPIPKGVELIAKSYGKAMGSPFKLAKFLYDAVGDTFNVAREALLKKITPPPFPFKAPKTIFNTKVSTHRTFAATEFSLEELKRIKNQFKKIALNDVLLSICAGGLQKYLKHRNELPDKPIVALAPISVRSQAENYQDGNKVSAMLVSLATDENEPIKQIEEIHQSAVKSKIYSKGIGVDKLMQFVPSELMALAARLYAQMDVSTKLEPDFNLVITNVPSSSTPLYMNGSKLLSYWGMSPLLDGLGLLIAICSYNDKITFSVTSCRQIMPDTERFVSYLQESFEELKMSLEPTK